MKLPPTNILILGGAALVGAYFLWPKIKENFSFNTTKAYPVPGNPSPNVMPFPIKRYDPNLGHGPRMA